MIFKKFNPEDVTTTVGSISEQVVLKPAFYFQPSNANVKNERHFLDVGTGASGAYFNSVYDGNPSLPWSNKLFTVAYGLHSASSLSGSFPIGSIESKWKMYRLYAKTLLGDEDAVFIVNSVPQYEVLFFSIARNQFKDQILPNTSFVGVLNGATSQQPTSSTATIAYFGDQNTKTFYDFRGGMAGDLYGVNSKVNNFTASNQNASSSTSVGLVFYDHGTYALLPHKLWVTGSPTTFIQNLNFTGALSSSNKNFYNAILNKMADISFYNVTRPRVTYFDCIMEKEEFNYSSNPSYKNDNGEIIINSGSNKNNKPTTYITQIALTNDLGQVLAVAKLTEPVKKDFNKKIKLRPRLIT